MMKLLMKDLAYIIGSAVFSLWMYYEYAQNPEWIIAFFILAFDLTLAIVVFLLLSLNKLVQEAIYVEKRNQDLQMVMSFAKSIFGGAFTNPSNFGQKPSREERIKKRIEKAIENEDFELAASLQKLLDKDDEKGGSDV